MITINTQINGIVYLKDKVEITLTMTDVEPVGFKRRLVYTVIDTNNNALTIPYSYEPYEGEVITIDFQDLLKPLVHTPAPIIGGNIGTAVGVPEMYKEVQIQFEEISFDTVECTNEVTQTEYSGNIKIFNISHSYNSWYSELFDASFEVLNTKSVTIQRAGDRDQTYDYLYLKTNIGDEFSLFVNYFDAEGTSFPDENIALNFTCTHEVTRVCTYNPPLNNLLRYAYIVISKVGAQVSYNYTVEIGRPCYDKLNLMYLTQRGGYNYLTVNALKRNFPTVSNPVFIRFEGGVGGNTQFHKESTLEYDCELIFTKVDEYKDILAYNEFIGSARYFVTIKDREDRINIIEAICDNFNLDTNIGKITFKLRHTLPLDNVNYYI